MLPGVTLVAEHNVGAHAALPCLVQDWALHGKREREKCIHAAVCLLEDSRDVVLCCVGVDWIESCLVSSGFNLIFLCLETDTDQSSSGWCCTVVAWSLNGACSV